MAVMNISNLSHGDL